MAALVAGTVALLWNFFVVPALLKTTPWVAVRLAGSILLGKGVLAPPATAHMGALVAAIATHYVLALVMTAIIAYVVHRGGLMGGILIGGLLGLSFFCIDYYSLTYLHAAVLRPPALVGGAGRTSCSARSPAARMSCWKTRSSRPMSPGRRT